MSSAVTPAGFGLRDILQDPDHCCALRWNDPAMRAAKRSEIDAVLTALEALRPALRETKTAKQLCARDFGRIKAEGGDLNAAKAHMQQLSTALSDLERRQREAEEALMALFAVDEPVLPPWPARFKTFSRPHTDPITIAELTDDPLDISTWSQYVEAHPQASLYHDLRWREVIQRSFGHETFYLIARDAARQPCGVLPLVRLRSRLFGDFAVSVPFFNYGGVLANNDDVATGLLDAAAAIAQREGFGHLEIRATRPMGNWPQRTDKVSMIRALPRTADELDKELGAKVRAQISRARQTNAQCRIGGRELLDDFYRVFAINMRDLGTPVYGRSFFENILQVFPAQACIVAVRLNNRPVAAAFLLGHGEMMEIPWASTLRSVNALNINMLMYREILGFCIEQGRAFFDFGRSTKEAGTFKFKKQWGAEPLQHYWHYWLPHGGPLPELKPDSPKFRLAVAAWQKLPVTVSTLIGPRIVKFLP